MSDKLNPSSAVASLRKEQARQSDSDSGLDSALEDTFPASDPVSMTGSFTAGGASDAVAETGIEPAPKVDEALAAVRSRSPSEREQMALAELRAMKEELSLLVLSAGRTEIRPKRSFGLPKLALPADVDHQIRLHPIAAVGAAALFGYVWGISR